MKAHIVGSGFGGLAAAALLIRNADVPGADITIYEADDVLGGGCGAQYPRAPQFPENREFSRLNREAGTAIRHRYVLCMFTSRE